MSVDGSVTAFQRGASLEEEAARRDAVGMASKPDMAPLVSVRPLLGVGMPLPEAGFESTLYMPVERQEQVSSQNMAVAFQRLDLESPSAEATPIITDAVILTSTGKEDLVTVHLGPKYTVVKEDLLGGGEGDGDLHAYLAVKSEPAGSCTEAPLVDLAIVYGAPGEGEAFEMGGGFDTLELPASVAAVYGARLYMCLKREGSGALFAEQMAARAAAEAASAMESESGFHNASGVGGGGLENELDDELLDTSLSPEQIRELEERRAREMRERAMRLEAEAEEQRREAYGAELRKALNKALDRRDELAARNEQLNKAVAGFLMEQSAADENRGASLTVEVAALEAEKAYGDALNGIVEVEERQAVMAADFERVTRELQTRLDEKEAKAADIYETFRAFKTQIALQSQHSRTGKGLPKKDVEAFRDAEKAKDEEASRVRLRNVTLRLTLRKLEAQLKAKEQLAEGLNVIDFEQLKIENTSLNEKIEDRSAELSKLKKKKGACVEVLSHVKAKLHYLRQSAAAAQSTLSGAEAQVGAQRETMARAKREREALKRGNSGFATDQGFTGNNRLVSDFENRRKELVALKEKIAETKDKYMNLASFVEGNGG